MRISVVKEIKPQETRVGLTPAGVTDLVQHGHEVFVERGAGDASAYSDADYVAAGARLVDQDTAWANAELLLKVKEPIASEYRFLRPDLTIFAYLHLAANRPLTEALVEAGTFAIGYETVQDDTGLPLLTPMSEIAGRLAAHAAATYLMSQFGGPGLLLGGAPGVAPARVLIIGGGAVGTNAAFLARGMGAEVTVLDTSAKRIRQLDAMFEGRVRVLMSDPHVLEDELRQADVVVGAVLVPGRAAPKVVRREHLGLLRPDALLIDVAIDQGGAFETSRPTTYEDPIVVIDGLRHYCVANMPSAVPHTSTRALTSVTLAYVREMADRGVAAAVAADASLAAGVNVRDGAIVYPGVAEAFPDLPSATLRAG
ncbi:alanine dehydrogenase [Gulosibacter molinativorax]|uniref:Alanine dehydrogenase n=1 Tax=Gulosibacter molinativorax TaxID=256821 RepID=A0ABT7C8D0_9MICO|nr:alanine dehydrogenase [Gulosibacter molinativorax]MDJ1371024.1 alanine dehydrogenase [Gulosibacter molinativorax]QUY62819.1 Alanine dehydrogenase [Gulosibacter molinativorax]